MPHFNILAVEETWNEYVIESPNDLEAEDDFHALDLVTRSKARVRTVSFTETVHNIAPIKEQTKMYKVESNIPLPQPKRLVPTTYPWREMKVGDSFAVPEEKKKALYTAMKVAKDDYKIKLASRRCIENDATVYRVWRIE